MPDRGARTVIVTRSERAFHIIFAARGHRESDHVDQKLLAFAPHALRQLRHIERGDALRERFGDCGPGQIVRRHVCLPRFTCRPATSAGNAHLTGIRATVKLGYSLLGLGARSLKGLSCAGALRFSPPSVWPALPSPRKRKTAPKTGPMSRSAPQATKPRSRPSSASLPVRH